MGDLTSLSRGPLQWERGVLATGPQASAMDFVSMVNTTAPHDPWLVESADAQ